MTTYYTQIDSPVGPLMLTSDGTSLTRLHFNGTVRPEWVRDDSVSPLREASRQLKAYFAGDLRDFDLPIEFEGSPFQKRVWEELLRIPYGTTISYGELARRIGDPNASRAVGLANGRNPIAIIVPCHRVIGANGKLVGYGGGMDRKQLLLSLEGCETGQAGESARQPALF